MDTVPDIFEERCNAILQLQRDFRQEPDHILTSGEKQLLTSSINKFTGLNIVTTSVVNRCKTLLEQSNYREKFEALRDDPEQFPLTQEILKDPDFLPTHMVEIDGKKFYTGNIMKNPRDRDYSVMFVEDESGKIFPRLCYHSNSDGSWRAARSVEKIHDDEGFPYIYYDKAEEIHYTQATKLHEDILENLKINQVKKITKENSWLPTDFFDKQRLKEEGLFEFKGLLYDDKGKLQGPQSYPEGELGKNDLSEMIDVQDWSRKINEIPNDFTPDFSQKIKQKRTQEHSLLGKITIETYESVFDGKKVDWNMAYDSQGRVWVDSIRFSDDGITTHGTFKNIIDTGGITNKPLDYKIQSNLIPDTYKRTFEGDDTYNDITPLLNGIKAIKMFRKARNIYPKGKSKK